MSVRSKMPCWEITQCNKRETCLCAENGKKACWEMVKANDTTSFHNCIDCLVYLAKHKDSNLTKEAFYSIMEQRLKAVNRGEYSWIPSHTPIRLPIHAKGSLKKHRPPQHDTMSL